MKYDNIKTSAKEIVEYWQKQDTFVAMIDEVEEATDYCWRCFKKAVTKHCFIVDPAMGGKDEPSNFMLLCEECCAEAPDVSDPAIIWDWLAAYQEFFDDNTFMAAGSREYGFIYGHSFQNEVNELFAQAMENKMSRREFDIGFQKCMQQIVSREIAHWESTESNAATVAGILRMTLKKYAAENGLELR